MEPILIIIGDHSDENEQTPLVETFLNISAIYECGGQKKQLEQKHGCHISRDSSSPEIEYGHNKKRQQRKTKHDIGEHMHLQDVEVNTHLNYHRENHQ